MLELSARAMARAMASGEISSVELVELHLGRIEAVNGQLNAAIEVFADEARAAARAADEQLAAGGVCGPLHGVPFSVKDSIDVRGHRTTAGTLGFKDSAPAVGDAVLVSRLRQAGAIPVCKTNLPDLLFAYETDNLLFGRTDNPYDLSRTSGGSSGGESALISACGSPFGLGSDAAGSVRVPAAFCGIASIKPTSGRLPRTGHVPPAGGWIEALWQIGPMARHVEDLQALMPILAGADGHDVFCPPAVLDDAPSISGLRVAYFTDNGIAKCSAELVATVERAAQALADAGAAVDQVRPPGVEYAYDLEMSLLGADGAEGIEAYMLAIGSHQQHFLLREGFLNRMKNYRCSTADLGQRWAHWDRYRVELAEFFTNYDAVVSPVYTEAALRHGESVQEERFRGFSYAMAWNVGGHPAAVVRCGSTGEGLPLSVQVITPRWCEMRALSISACLEERLGGWQPSPLFGRDESKSHR